MKLCLFTSVYAMSDIDKHAAFLVESNKHLMSRGHEIHVLAPSYEGLKSHTVRGVKVHRFRYFFKRWEHLTHTEGAPNRVGNPFYLFVAVFYVLAGLIAAIRLCRKEKFDLVHVHWPFPHGVWGVAVKWLTGTPIAFVFHGAELLLAKRFFFVEPCLKFFIRRASALMCNSNFTAGQLRKITDKPIDIIPYGCSVNARDDIEKPKNIKKKLLFVGRIIERKGLPFLLQAIPLVNEKVEVHLDIVGLGKAKEECERLAQALNIEDQVTFHGFVEDDELEQMYADADVFVLPSVVDNKGDTEGLGVVLVEALSFKTPVVASDVGGISDVIINEKTGLLVEERSAESLASAIVKILTDETLAATVVDQGLKHAQHYFSWQRIVEKVDSVSQRVIASS
ncbi:glycosyltransferase family 4 protein [Litoribacillus peritrichatus]|uniref:Glycosyltransferase family 4 protein n=1 Tax=Litoribacillus peritrichatus TaxID=718191 RepID=A0ABP7M945_9GAMM